MRREWNMLFICEFYKIWLSSTKRDSIVIKVQSLYKMSNTRQRCIIIQQNLYFISLLTTARSQHYLLGLKVKHVADYLIEKYM